MTVSAWIRLLGVLAASCARSDASPPVPRAEPATASPAWPDALQRPSAPLIVAIGDLHGDLQATRRALRLAGAIDESDHWSGGELVVVQTGDTIDRGEDDRAVLDLLERLRGEAERAGGALIALSGNHELMNVAGDLRYVSPASFAAFGGERERVEAFRPGGPYARMLAEWPLTFKVGATIFVHGGILPKHVAYGIGRMQREVREWLLGARPMPPEIVMAEDGPIWTRYYSLSPGRQECDQLGRVLDALDAKRLVVGHTVQPTGVNSACGGRVWRIDVGLSHFYGGPLQVLELRGDRVSVRGASAPQPQVAPPP